MKNKYIENSLKNYSPFIFVCIATLVYIIYWSWISLYRLFTFQAGVYDLGISAQEFYIVYHQPFFSINTLSGILNRDVMYIFSPLFFFNTYELMLIVQTIFLSVPSILLYFISMKVTRKASISVSVSLVYLMYPLLAGVNWFDFHNQSFFIFFFILAFYLYIEEHFIYSAVFFIIAGMTHYLFMIVVCLFSLPLLLETVHAYLKGNSVEKEKRFGVVVFIISIVLLGLSFYLNSLQHVTISSVIHSTGINVFSNLSEKLIVVAIAIFPFAFLTVIPNRYSLLILPFFFLLFFSSNSIYFFPGITMDQYSSLLIPGIFISTIYGVNTLLKRTNALSKMNKSKRRPSRAKIIAVTMVLLTVGSGLLLEPYGPLNHESENHFNTQRPLNSYLPLFKQFNKMVSLIPKNATSVVIGDGEPTALPRPQIVGAPLLITPYNIAGNLTYLSNSGKWVRIYPKYIIGNPYNVMFTLSSGPIYNLSMYNLINRLYSSGIYGILAEASGMILLEKNYSGPIQYYVPMEYALYRQFLTSTCSGLLGNSLIFTGSDKPFNINSSRNLNGPIFIPPGRYNICINTSSITIPNNDILRVQLENGNGNEISNVNILANYTKNYIVIDVYLISMVEYSRISISIEKGEQISINYIKITQNANL